MSFGNVVLVNYWLLNYSYSFDGRVVAKLPFIPISWLQGLSHRNLMGDDYTDCSFIFLYILCTMSIRQVSRQIFLIYFELILKRHGFKVQECKWTKWNICWPVYRIFLLSVISVFKLKCIPFFRTSKSYWALHLQGQQTNTAPIYLVHSLNSLVHINKWTNSAPQLFLFLFICK